MLASPSVTYRMPLNYGLGPRCGHILAWIVLVLAAGRLRGGEPIPVGGEFQVNTYTTGYQYSSRVSPDGAGGFAVIWASSGSGGTDTDGSSIHARRYGPDGTPLGGQFQVNTYTTSYQDDPSVSPDGSGGFVVAWSSFGSSGTDTAATSIQGQRYGPDGAPLGGQFQVNTYTTNIQAHPAASLDGAGGFVVTWESSGSSGTDTSFRSIQGQRYDPDGAPLGGEFQVNTYTTSTQTGPAVSEDASGGFVVVWRSVGSSGTDLDGASIQGQRYGPDGLPLDGQFQVNTYTTTDQGSPAVTPHGSGGFVVVWVSGGSSGTDTDGASIQGQRYGPDGAPLGGEFQVNTYTTSSQVQVAPTSDGSGGFVVTWTSLGSSGTDTDITSVQGQRYGPDGSPLGGQFQINTYTTGGQEASSAGLDGSGNLVITWGSSTDIQGQRYTLPLFADGFESGDTTAWSSTVPQGVHRRQGGSVHRPR